MGPFTLATAGPVWVDIANNADPERAATQSTFTNSLKLLRQARERLGQGLRAVEAGTIAESDEISLRNR